MSASSSDGCGGVVVDAWRDPCTDARLAACGFFMGSCCNGILEIGGGKSGLSGSSESELGGAAAGAG